MLVLARPGAAAVQHRADAVLPDLVRRDRGDLGLGHLPDLLLQRHPREDLLDPLLVLRLPLEPAVDLRPIGERREGFLDASAPVAVERGGADHGLCGRRGRSRYGRGDAAQHRQARDRGERAEPRGSCHGLIHSRERRTGRSSPGEGDRVKGCKALSCLLIFVMN